MMEYYVLYHDQGLSPMKTLDFFNSINVTAGLPIIKSFSRSWTSI